MAGRTDIYRDHHVERNRMNRGSVVVVAALLIGIAVWVSWRGRQPGKAATQEARGSAVPVAPAPRTSASTVAVANDGLPIMPAGPNDPVPDGPVHPHPITAEHARIYEENRLIGALNGAMDVKDVPAMRRLLDEYREQYPEDDQMLQGGYAVIAGTRSPVTDG
jgi:hypothetical protein